MMCPSPGGNRPIDGPIGGAKHVQEDQTKADNKLCLSQVLYLHVPLPINQIDQPGPVGLLSMGND